jgi:hypothetical protein
MPVGQAHNAETNPGPRQKVRKMNRNFFLQAQLSAINRNEAQ